MPLISTEAVVLQSYPYSETSKILRLLTRNHGVTSVIAKGALRPRSQYAGVLEPFSIGQASIYLKEGRDLQTLSGFDLIRTGQGLGRDLIRFGSAALIAELVLRSASSEADAALYEQVSRGLDRIDNASNHLLEPVALAEAWALLALLGFAPIVDYCIGCDRGLGVTEECRFDYAAGGPRCTECAGGIGGRSLPPHAREALGCFIRGEAIKLDRTAAHWALLGRFLDYHLADGSAIHSLRFLTEAVGGE
jgi:DNA repair protein RecO (recombination protein O)